MDYGDAMPGSCVSVQPRRIEAVRLHLLARFGETQTGQLPACGRSVRHFSDFDRTHLFRDGTVDRDTDPFPDSKFIP